MLPSIAEGGNTLCLADDHQAVDEGSDVDLVRVLIRSAEVQFGDVLEAPGVGCERFARQEWNVTILIEELSHCPMQVVEPFGLFPIGFPGGGCIRGCATPRACINLAEQFDSIEGPALALTTWHHQAALQDVDAQQMVQPLANLVHLHPWERADSGSEGQIAFPRSQAQTVALGIRLAVRLTGWLELTEKVVQREKVPGDRRPASP